MFTALVEYKQTYGDCNVPKTWRDNPQLATWVTSQRKKFEEQTIKPDLCQRLESVGFEWQPEKTDPWEEMFAALIEFKRQHGHCKVPRKYENVQGLARWVNSLRVVKQKGELDASKVSRLEAIGFVWNVVAETWEKMFTELKRYKKTNGDCAVLTNRRMYKRLATWINEQRFIWQKLQEGLRQARPHTLSRMKRLEELGIDFSSWERSATTSSNTMKHLEELGFDFGKSTSHSYPSRPYRWEEGFTVLEHYKAQHGHCSVPSNSEEHRRLATWVKNQRAHMKSGRLTEQQIDWLTQLGFVWDLHEFNWQKMYEALSVYKLRNGHCRVPSEWPDNPRLASWVSSQRYARSAGNLSEKRISLLDAIGFIWDKDRS